MQRDGKVLGDGWVGWRIDKSLLVDTNGNQTTRGQLQAYYLIYQLCRELKRGDAAAEAAFTEIMRAVG